LFDGTPVVVNSRQNWFAGWHCMHGGFLYCERMSVKRHTIATFIETMQIREFNYQFENA